MNDPTAPLPEILIAFFRETVPESVEMITWEVDLVETRLLDSLHFAELVFYLEDATGSEIDLTALTIDTFRTVGSICDHFFSDGIQRDTA
jgi:acyl carrier protein